MPAKTLLLAAIEVNWYRSDSKGRQSCLISDWHESFFSVIEQSKVLDSQNMNMGKVWFHHIQAWGGSERK